MARRESDDRQRIAFRIRPSDKATIIRAAALAQTGMTEFVVDAALREARAVIAGHESRALTRRDSRLVLEFLEHPPAASSKLRKSARAMPQGARI